MSKLKAFLGFLILVPLAALWVIGRYISIVCDHGIFLVTGMRIEPTHAELLRHHENVQADYKNTGS
jgi:hypothetical protein